MNRYINCFLLQMKIHVLFLACVLIPYMFACQSETVPENGLTDEEILSLGISKDDAVKKLSHTPTEVVYVETTNKPIKIDFGCSNELLQSLVNTSYCSWWDPVQTVGELVAFYKTQPPVFPYGYSSNMSPCSHNFLYTRMEYLLAQECFRNDCSTMTRKAVLAMVVEKHPYKYELFIEPGYSIRTGIFLMAVILIKEKDVDFIIEVHECPDLQNALCLTYPEDIRIDVDKEFGEFVRQFAINFLSNE